MTTTAYRSKWNETLGFGPLLCLTWLTLAGHSFRQWNERMKHAPILDLSSVEPWPSRQQPWALPRDQGECLGYTSDDNLTAVAPYLALRGELWSVLGEHFGGKWQSYKEIWLPEVLEEGRTFSWVAAAPPLPPPLLPPPPTPQKPV